MLAAPRLAHAVGCRAGSLPVPVALPPRTRPQQLVRLAPCSAAADTATQPSTQQERFPVQPQDAATARKCAMTGC